MGGAFLGGYAGISSCHFFGIDKVVLYWVEERQEVVRYGRHTLSEEQSRQQTRKIYLSSGERGYCSNPELWLNVEGLERSALFRKI